MKPLTNHRALLAAYNKGDIEQVAADLNRYQTIEHDHEWSDDKGENRRKAFLVKHSKGVARWHVKMLNGSVMGVGCVYEVDLSRPFYTA